MSQQSLGLASSTMNKKLQDDSETARTTLPPAARFPDILLKQTETFASVLTSQTRSVSARLYLFLWSIGEDQNIVNICCNEIWSFFMVEPHQNTLHESLEDGGESKRNHLNSYNPFGATKAVFSCELKCMQIYQYPVATSRVEKYTDSLSWSSNQSMGEEKCQPWSLNLALGNQHRTCVYHPSSHKHNGTCP